MKLIYAGQGETVKNYTDLLFNCIRNAKCQRPFYVPIKQFSDITFYADMPGLPSLMQIEVMNVCDIENIGSAVASSYVIGTKPDGSYYGVFGSLLVVPPDGVIYNRFFFKLSFTIDGIVHVFYSEQYEFPLCEELTALQGCYPNEALGVDAFDCNGVYYGFSNDTENFLGTYNYRYFHLAYLRMASIIEQRNTFSFTAFNRKKTYKSNVVREWLFEFEIVPSFYKDVLLGIFARGNVRVDGNEWKLAESQDISMIDTDSKLWRMDMTFDEECKQTFGCKPADCVLPPETCCDPEFISAIVETIGCVAASILSGGSLPDGVVGTPYVHVITLGGTGPFTLSGVSKPSWMNINVVGDEIQFSGTPTTETTEGVEFNIENCEDDILPFSDEFDVTEEGGGGGTPIPGMILVDSCAVEYAITAVRESGNNFAGFFPVNAGGSSPSNYPAGTYNVQVTIVTGGGAGSANLSFTDSEGNVQCQNIPGAGIFNFPGVILNNTNGFSISLSCGDCA